MATWSTDLTGRTAADGLRTNLCPLTFEHLARYLDDIVTVSEAAIIAGMRQIWEVMKIIVEPSGAVPYAAVLESRIPTAGCRIGIVLSGGNLDLDSYPWL